MSIAATTVAVRDVFTSTLVRTARMMIPFAPVGTAFLKSLQNTMGVAARTRGELTPSEFDSKFAASRELTAIETSEIDLYGW